MLTNREIEKANDEMRLIDAEQAWANEMAWSLNDPTVLWVYDFDADALLADALSVGTAEVCIGNGLDGTFYRERRVTVDVTPELIARAKRRAGEIEAQIKAGLLAPAC